MPACRMAPAPKDAMCGYGAGAAFSGRNVTIGERGCADAHDTG